MKKSCKIWPGAKDKDGYGTTSGWTVGTRKAHRIAFQEYWGVTLPSWLLVIHDCDNPPCYEVEHLRVGTHLDNQRDCTAKGRGRIGERNGQAKLTDETATYAMARLLFGESQPEVARSMNVLPPAINKLWLGRTWKHLWRNDHDEQRISRDRFR